MLAELTASRFVQRAAGMVSAVATGLGSLRVALNEGEGDEQSRAGLRFHMSAQGATGIAPVQALMSTAAQWMLFNPTANQVTAYLDVLGVVLVSGTAGAGGTLHWCTVTAKQAPSTVPTASASGVTVKNAHAMSVRASQLVVVSGQTLQNAAAGDWSPLAFMNPAGTVLGQTQMELRDIRGKIMIAPGCGVGLAVISPTGTSPLFAPYGSWREYASDNE